MSDFGSTTTFADSSFVPGISSRGRMGDVFLKTNRLTEEEVDAIVDMQNRLHIRFGEAAIRLGLLTEKEIHDVLINQFNYVTVSASTDMQGLSPTLYIAHSPFSNEAEAIRRLRSEILVRMGENEHIALTVVSPGAGEGKSYTAASLAIAFAQINKRTLLIDANLRNPTQHELFGLENKSGLSTILAGRSGVRLDAHHPVLPRLQVLTSGPLPPNPQEILRAPKLSNLLERYADDIDIFIVDTPSTTSCSDAQIIARQIGIALMIGLENQTTIAELRHTHEAMMSAGVQLIGTVYNQRPAKGRKNKPNTGLIASQPKSLWQRLTGVFSRDKP